MKSKHAYKVTFSLPKEAVDGAKDVKILGDFNNWEKDNAIPMKAENGGYKATLELNPGREYEFRYLINDEKWENDWEADKYSLSPYGVENSVVVIPAEMEK